MLASEPYDAARVVWNRVAWSLRSVGPGPRCLAYLLPCQICQVYALQSVLVLGVNLGLSYVAPASTCNAMSLHATPTVGT